MDVVTEQLDAYNARDIDRFLACYAPDAVIDDADGREVMRGHDGIRALYAVLFAQSPGLRCNVAQRIRVGSHVIDEEFVSGANLVGWPSEAHAAVIYRVEDGLISRARVLL